MKNILFLFSLLALFSIIIPQIAEGDMQGEVYIPDHEFIGFYDETNTYTVFAGIKKAYREEKLKDKLVVCVNNLKPREMRFGTSEGMILAAGDDAIGIFIISPDEGAAPGMKVR